MASPTIVLAGLALALCAGCPPPGHYLTADVTMAHTPLEGALVAAECGYSHAAKITNAEGRARLRLTGSDLDSQKCIVTVGVPELPPVESHDASLCTAPDACPALTFDFAEIPNATPFVTSEAEPHGRGTQPRGGRSYATPPRRMEVAR